MQKLITTTALAATFALGLHGAPFAQGVNPSQPNSAAGGLRAQAGQSSGTAPHGASQAGTMTEDQLRTALQARGYAEIEGLKRDGDHFTVEQAKRYGSDVEDLRVDARTGQVRDEERLNEDQARNLLRSRGYSDVSDVSRDGDTISAKAKRGDREVNLRIDARSGTVTQQQASN